MTWENWQLHVGFSWREGLILNNLQARRDGGKCLDIKTGGRCQDRQPMLPVHGALPCAPLLPADAIPRRHPFWHPLLRAFPVIHPCAAVF